MEKSEMSCRGSFNVRFFGTAEFKHGKFVFVHTHTHAVTATAVAYFPAMMNVKCFEKFANPSKNRWK